MRVLWFEVTTPKKFIKHEFHGAGWQDALEHILTTNSEIELAIAFESKNNINKKKINNTLYYPLYTKYNIFEKIIDLISWKVSRNKLIPICLNVIEEFKPDVIHVFGSEWCFGQVAEFTNIPVIIHMQGSIPPYNNAFYPPGYNKWDELLFNLSHFKFKSLIKQPLSLIKQKSWEKQEERTLSIVNNYMGRTEWDKAIINLYHPNANYYYCSEALRPSFINSNQNWHPTGNQKLKLATTGCSSLWKGLDTIVRTAKILKEKEVDFEWILIGQINHKEFIEWKEKIKMEDINIRLMGMLGPNELINELYETDIYIHTAYIDNSPNSICEAQYLGIPIIATYVGGIPSLIENKHDGLLIPANDPYVLANEIIKIETNINQQLYYSKNTSKRAKERHNPKVILENIINIYKSIIVYNKQ